MLANVSISLLWGAFLLLGIGLAFGYHRCGSLLFDGAVLVGGAAVFMAGLVATPLWGLEYEDAYEYEYAARLLAHHGPFDHDALNPICIDGSLVDCSITGSLSHPIGIAVLGSWWLRVVGPLGVGAVPALSLVMLVICVLVLGTILRREGDSTAAYGATALLLSLPSSAYFGSGFAEPFSATLTIVAVGCAWCVWKRDNARRIDPWSYATLAALAVAVALAILCKREALAVPGVLVPTGIALWYRDRKGSRCSALLVSIAALTGAVMAFAVAGHDLFAAQAITPAGRWPFSGANIARFLPYALGMLVRTPSAIVIVLLSGVALARRGTRHLAALCVAISVTYTTAFLAFDQDYATVATGSVPDHHFVRYVLQVAPLTCVAAGLGVAQVARWARTLRPTAARAYWLGLATFVGIATWSGWSAGSFRSELRREEDAVRIGPVRSTCAHLPSGSMLVTAEPIVAGLVCPPTTLLLDATSMGQFAVEHERMGRPLFYLRRARTEPVLADRYPRAAAALRRFEEVPVANYGAGVQLVRLQWPSVRPTDH